MQGIESGLYRHVYASLCKLVYRLLLFYVCNASSCFIIFNIFFLSFYLVNIYIYYVVRYVPGTLQFPYCGINKNSTLFYSSFKTLFIASLYFQLAHGNNGVLFTPLLDKCNNAVHSIILWFLL